MSEPDQPPVTGDDRVDAALARAQQALLLPGPQRLQRLAELQQTLRDLLEESRAEVIPAQTTIPGVS